MSLKITIIQTKLFWHDRAKNLEWFRSKIDSHPGHTDIYVLPEMFSTGFSMKVEGIAETMDGEAVRWMKELASEKNAVVTGSLMMKEKDSFYNRLIWMFPDGKYEYYDKRHLFRMAGENDHYSNGNSRIIINYKGWKICPLICYDLRFPVWSRNRFKDGKYDYDCLIYVANWPERRSLAWKTLIHARSIENLAYVVAVNRIGLDGNDVNYSGDSAVIDFKGETLSRTSRFGDRCETVELSMPDLVTFRDSFPAGMDSDNFSLQI